ncbi:MAG TPA: DUF6370 family protein [Gemmataceae bacterium]|nr:DUF6370 family protein [Gemmataceae bacterium]
MKAIFAIVFAAFVLGIGFTSRVAADEPSKLVVLKGKITCAKCELELTKRCASVIVVKENGKEVIYFFDTDGNKKYHAETCSQSRPGEVAGFISQKDGKKIITVTRVTFQD